MLTFINKYKPEYTARSKEFFALSTPIFLEQTFVVLLGIATTVMVSRVGDYSLPAASMIESITNLISAFFAALTIGSTIVVAQYTGRSEHGKASGVAAQALLLAAFFGVIFCVFLATFRVQVIDLLFSRADYGVILDARLFLGITAFSFPAMAIMMTSFGILRGSGNTRAPMGITIIINIVNVVLGLILIRNFGVAGAAFALVISRYIGAVLGALYIVIKSTRIRFSGIKDFYPNIAIQKVILGLGIPTSIESGTFQMGKLLITIFMAGMGTAAIGANAIVNSFAGILNAPGSAFSTGTTILVGQRIGRGETEDVRKTTYFSVVAAMIMLLFLCLLTFFLTGPLLSIYHTTDEMLVILRPVLITLFIATPIAWPASFVTPAAVRATGDVKYTMVVAIASMVFVRIALAWFLGVYLGLGILGIWFSMYADWVVRGALFINRIRSGKWKGKGIVR